MFYLAEQETCFSGEVAKALDRSCSQVRISERKFLIILLAGRVMYTYMSNSFVLGVHCCLPQKGEHGHGTWIYQHISSWQQFCCLERLEPFPYPPSPHWGNTAAKHSVSSHPLLLAEAGWKGQWCPGGRGIKQSRLCAAPAATQTRSVSQQAFVSIKQ